MVHIVFHKNESCFAFPKLTKLNVKGEYLKYCILVEYYFYFASYDGAVFHNNADSKNGHYFTTLAKIDEAPLAVGGYSSNTKKAEILDVSTNTWTVVADYPYHD